MSEVSSNGRGLSLFWFRRDLRLHDNHGLYRALTSGDRVLPVFIFDRHILDELPANDRRVTFIHRQITSIHESLKKYGGDLHVYYGYPLEVMQRLVEQFPIKAVYTNHDYEPYARQRDEEIASSLKEKGIAFQSFKDQVLFERDDIMKQDGDPYTVYTPYSKKWLARLKEEGVPDYPSQDHLKAIAHLQGPTVPVHKAMGFEEVDVAFPGADPDEETIENYAGERNFPDRYSTTRIGVHLRFGTISVRDMIRKGQKHSETWLKQLIWREFFMSILYHFPKVVTQSFRPEYDQIKWENDSEKFDAWCQGKTGYPMVDAGMRELVSTGFMHNRVRMVTASFLSKHLLIDWRKGEAFFAKHLLDYELASNNGSWQWAAGTGCDAAPYFRVFNPTIQLEKFDPDRKYIRRWIKELDDPWKYPDPIVAHPEARDRAIKRYGEAVKK